MSLEKLYSLRAAAKLLGIGRATLKRWLAAELSLEFPQVPRGSKLLVRGSQLEQVAAKRGAHVNWALLRNPEVKRQRAKAPLGARVA